MKMLNSALIIALMLTAGVALAEQGSSEGNRIISPDSAPAKSDYETRHFSPSDLTDRNP